MLFDALAFGAFRAEAAGQATSLLEISRGEPDRQARLLLPPASS